MSTRRRKRKRKNTRTNITEHRRAMTDPDAVALVKDLRGRWKSLDRVERGERLRKLAAFGCSTRGLQEELGQSATTVRRHMELAGLPAPLREAVKAGASAKKILAGKAVVDKRKRLQARLVRDQRTGAISDEVAELILEFCKAEHRLPEIPIRKSDLETFVNAVRLCVDSLQSSGYLPVKVAKRLGLRTLIKRLRPDVVNENGFWIEFQAEWLARILLTRAPERPIWERALQKAQRRADELEPKKTLDQVYTENRQHLAKTLTFPGRRNY